MSITLNDITAAVNVDKHNLDEAIIRQPQLMWEATQALAKANKELAILERQKINLNAKLDGQFRAAPSESKLTETALAAKVRDHKDMRELNEEIIEARYQAELWDGAVKSLNDRRRSIEEAGNLYRANYFTRESTAARPGVNAVKDARADTVRREVGQRRAAAR